MKVYLMQVELLASIPRPFLTIPIKCWLNRRTSLKWLRKTRTYRKQDFVNVKQNLQTIIKINQSCPPSAVQTILGAWVKFAIYL